MRSWTGRWWASPVRASASSRSSGTSSPSSGSRSPTTSSTSGSPCTPCSTAPSGTTSTTRGRGGACWTSTPRTSTRPVGSSWRVGPSENNAETGGFYDILGPNNYAVESGSFAKLREVSLTYKVGHIGGVGDWTVGVTGRNLLTITNYTGFDPEVGAGGGSGAGSTTSPTGSGLINQVDAFNFPVLRTFTFSVSTRF